MAHFVEPGAEDVKRIENLLTERKLHQHDAGDKAQHKKGNTFTLLCGGIGRVSVGKSDIFVFYHGTYECFTSLAHYVRR